MNKQQLLDKKNPTTEESVMQQLLIRGSMTSLKGDARVFRRIHSQLYTTEMKQLPFENLMSCIANAEILAADGEVTLKPQVDGKPK